MAEQAQDIAATLRQISMQIKAYHQGQAQINASLTRLAVSWGISRPTIVIQKEAQLQVGNSNPEQEHSFEATIETQETSPEVFDIKIQAIQHQDEEEYIEISHMEGRLLDTCCEEYEDFDEVEAIQDILVEVPYLSAQEVDQHNEEQDCHGEDEATKVMEHLPIVSKVAHMDFMIGDTISKEEARLENRREVQSYMECFHCNGVSTIRGRIVLKKGGMIQSSLPRQFNSKVNKSGADRGSRFCKDSRSNLLQERGNDVISTSAIFNSRGPKMKVRIQRFKDQLGAFLMDKMENALRIQLTTFLGAQNVILLLPKSSKCEKDMERDCLTTKELS
ncbi:unnamed protein product [Linum trigynum]|uniref:Uncharacterized protein n=1 Tax=Linum trigynum TaxID=586398 RepID=A0AAV2ESR5_9ROSI